MRLAESPSVIFSAVMNQGGLFTRDYLSTGIKDTNAWKALDETTLSAILSDLSELVSRFPHAGRPSEPRTEDDLIWPVLRRLGWEATVRQQPLSAKGRENIPDGLLFADLEAKSRADRLISFERYGEGLALVESKKWNRLLDRPGRSKDETEVPSSQMLRYLRRVDDLTHGRMRWGILTNGRIWRLYYQGAKSVAEDFCELDLAAILGVEGYADLATPPTPAERAHWLKVFVLIFGRASFLPSTTDNRSFLEYSLEQGRFYEAEVAKDLSRIVFEEVFPAIAKGLVENDEKPPVLKDHAYCAEVKDAALILLYRLLFVLYAEDRNLLPVNDPNYDDYGLRKKVRNDVAKRIDEGDTFSSRRADYWNSSAELFKGIADGDPDIGLPPYNGGLFDAKETPLLQRAKLPDAIFAPVIDKLGRVERDGERRYINYRDLSVQQLGSIYERLLEYEVAFEAGELVIRLNPFARKGSGSYYTPDELVRLIIERTVGPLLEEKLKAFTEAAEALRASRAKKDVRLAQLRGLDPASAVLDLKICDPAMGSGHFLVDLVDYLADQIAVFTVTAREAVDWAEYQSPLIERVDSIRTQIKEQAEKHHWKVSDEQLDDRHIVRRMVLKRVVYGVDKNPMAVELAKVALWLHTFTVGAPLSFLDHHLRCGDSLFGETVRGVMDRLAKRGALTLHGPIQKARAATKSMEAIELETDADIAGVKNSAATFEAVCEATAPLAALMSLIHAFSWLDPSEREDRFAIDEWLDGNFGDPFEIARGRLKPRGAKPEQASLIPDGRLKQQDLMKGASAKEDVAARFAKLLGTARSLVEEERFHHWQIAFPGVWTEWESSEPLGGFDAVIGNPPWDQFEFDITKWFQNRDIKIAKADRRSQEGLLESLKVSNPALWDQFDRARHRVSQGMSVVRQCKSYPLLSKGRFNLFGLFVEKAMALISRKGKIGLLVPTGIAMDARSSRFLAEVFQEGRLVLVLDFENRGRKDERSWFSDIDARARFCCCVINGSEFVPQPCKAAMFLQSSNATEIESKSYEISYVEAGTLNYGHHTVPMFRTRRDFEIVRQSLLSRGSFASFDPKPTLAKFRYEQVFNKSKFKGTLVPHLELEANGYYPLSGNSWARGGSLVKPVLEGKMVQAYDHRAAHIVFNPDNLHRANQPRAATPIDKASPDFMPAPAHWIEDRDIPWSTRFLWTLAFKDSTSVTNARTMIAAVVPRYGIEHNLPALWPDATASEAAWLLSNLNSTPYDFLARTKIHHNHFTETFLEQVPLISLHQMRRLFGDVEAGRLVARDVIALTYTAHDMEPFARDMGYDGPPFAWDELDRLKRRARLDALYFILYGVTDRDDVRYIYSTFPIVEREERAAYGRFLSCDYCLMYMNALEAGDPDAEIVI